MRKGEISLQLLHAPWLWHSHWLLIDGPLDGWVTWLFRISQKKTIINIINTKWPRINLKYLVYLKSVSNGEVEFFVHIVEHTVFQIFGKQQFCRQTKVNSCFSCSFSLSAKFASIFFSFFFLIDEQFYFIAKYSFEEFSSQRLTEVRQWTPSPFQLKGKSPAVWIHNSIV